MIYNANSWYSPYTGQTGTGRELAAMGKTVTVEEKKIWLSRLNTAREELKALAELKLDRWERATSTTASYNGAVISESSTPHKLDAYVADVTTEKELRCEIKKLESEIRKAIMTIPKKNAQDRRRALMGFRYIQGMKWSEIAEEMHYTDRHIRNMHSSALADIRITRRQIDMSLGGDKTKKPTS